MAPPHNPNNSRDNNSHTVTHHAHNTQNTQNNPQDNEQQQRQRRQQDHQQQQQARPTLSVQTSLPQHQPMRSPITPTTAGTQSGSGVKKRKGARSVSTLTPQQLERKRANDREAQRAIRARTKENIERLERKVKIGQQALHDAARENYQIRTELNHLRAEVKHLRDKHDDHEAFMPPYDPMTSAPTPTPGRGSMDTTTSPLFLSQPVTPADTRPPPSYGILSSGGSHFGAGDDTSPSGPTYVTGMGDQGEWSSALLHHHNPLQHCSLPSPTSAGGGGNSGVDGSSFMPNPNTGHGMDSMATMIRTPQPDGGLDLDDMGRADVGGYGNPGVSLSPSPGVGCHSHFDGAGGGGGHTAVGSLTPGGHLQQTHPPYLHQPHPQHFSSAVSFVQGGPFQPPGGNHHLYPSGNYYSPASRSPVTM